MSSPFKILGTPQKKLSQRQVRAVAEKVGFTPAQALQMAQIARGESGFQPKVQQPDPGDGMVGYGLWQMTPNAWGEAGRKKMEELGGLEAMADPVQNAKMAKYLFDQAGGTFQPWYGTRYLDRNTKEGSVRSVLGSTPIPGGGSNPQPQRESTTLKQVQGFDQAGFERAQKLAFLGQLVARRNPQSTLVKLGVLPSSAPTPEEFQTSSLRAVTTRSSSQGKNRPAAWKKGHVGSIKLHELFYNGPGGVNVKEGQVEPTGFVSGHTDHVHVAAQTRGETERLARLAQRMGLTVRELAPFDKVDPVHTTNSWHYAKSGAADVSGPTDLMRKYSRKVARKAGLL